MKISLLDGKQLELNSGMSVLDIAESIATSLKKVCVGAKINGKMVSPFFKVTKDAQLEIITDKSVEFEYAKKYSSKLATMIAVKKMSSDNEISSMYKKEINDFEFGVSFKFKESIKLENLKDIQKEISKVLKESKSIEFVSDDASKFEKELLSFYGNKEFTKFIIKESKENGFSVAKYDKFYFVVTAPLITNFAKLKQIELINLTGEYWLGNADNAMLQKIHGITGNSDEIKAIKDMLKDREERDHRTIGKKLDIFTINPILGHGMAVWLPNGTTIKNEIKNYLKAKEFEYDFVPIETPNLGSRELYETSGHWAHYRDDMFNSIKLPNEKELKEELVLRPMACPHHIQVFKHKPRSYKELPLRYCEHATLYRYEASGALVGLERVRSMELTDSHIFARPDQIKEEFKNCYELIKEVLETFKIKIDYLSLSLRDPEDKEKYYDDDEMWNNAEKQLEEVLDDLGVDYKKMEGEAAFYGPKLDIQAKTVLGHEITVSTIQLDFLLPMKFDVNYLDKNLKPQRAVMIHRGLIGTYERFISILLEQTKGALPLWCSPTQIEIIPVLERFNDAALKLSKELKTKQIRTHVDMRDERLSYKVREAQMKKIPYQVILGEEEINDNVVSFRKYGSKSTEKVNKDEFIKKIVKEIETKYYNI
ncbi:threonyl-tRNA synthetase [Spiroplasma sp. TIUS-1]|uniref:threonine--tRNA ligase n=1 Tax=Spiroplasma sp. TIUS-1 TaxID=216963 RepID=UPI0013988F58|nr:threonine--tRNA ligase [Spiroplasma sp. TIUS-1]QHX36066.1 threonyl-tRNA synthetase [Spiroplasma sp. TIUS-1]